MTPIHGLDTCGRAVDYIRHEYLGTVRPYYDAPDVEVPVQWYFVPEDTPWVPQPNAFNDSRDNDYGFEPFIGQTRAWEAHYTGNFGAWTGKKACGDADAWLNGVSLFNPTPCECPQCMCVPVQEVPAGTIDGMNRVFTLSQSPLSNASVQVFINGVFQTQGVNYSLTVSTIRFAGGSTPQTGDVVSACYQVQGGE